MTPITTEISNEGLEVMHNAQYDAWFESETLLHYCPDWDGLLVDALDREGEGSCCTCNREMLRNTKRDVPELSTEIENTTAWPFAITNGVRNPESQTLLNTKGKLCATIRPDLDNEQDALF